MGEYDVVVPRAVGVLNDQDLMLDGRGKMEDL
jgi:hypothetical protein